jgi:hypothetical protein
MRCLLRFAGLAVLGIGVLYGQGRITCSSENGGRNYCGADTSRGVTLVRQIGVVARNSPSAAVPVTIPVIREAAARALLYNR